MTIIPKIANNFFNHRGPIGLAGKTQKALNFFSDSAIVPQGKVVNVVNEANKPLATLAEKTPSNVGEALNYFG